MEPTRIIAIRHGETTWNVDTRIQGHLDIPLNETGRKQAERMALALADEPISAIYSSDLAARMKPRAPSAMPGIQVTRTKACASARFGMFEGKTFDEIHQTWPDHAQNWRKRIPEWEPPPAASRCCSCASA
jgi:probable phosphoglycerate mutase